METIPEEITRRAKLLVDDNINGPVAQDYLFIEQAMLIGVSIAQEREFIALIQESYCHDTEDAAAEHLAAICKQAEETRKAHVAAVAQRARFMQADELESAIGNPAYREIRDFLVQVRARNFPHEDDDDELNK